MIGIVIGIVFIVVSGIFSFILYKDKKAGESGRKKLNSTDKSVIKLFTAILLIAGIIVMLLSCYTIVDVGRVGVQDTFGVVSENKFQPGIHFKNPFTDVIQYSTQTMNTWEVSSVPSKEGLIVTLDVNIFYKINPLEAHNIHKNLGIDYKGVIMVPTLRSVTREVTSRYEAKALYSDVGRINITNDIFKTMEPAFAQRGIILEKVLLRDLQLPHTVTQAIEQKLKAEQEAEQMQFVLQKERMEADRKRVEAQGIADSQEIIDKSLTPEYLKWYWITHLREHSSVIYVPIGNDGFPLVKMVQ